MGADETSGFKSNIPRSMRTDNLANIVKMGALSKKRAVSTDDALRNDSDTLGQLARLYKPGKGTTESLGEELDMALKTPVPDDEDPTLGLVYHSFISSDSGFITEDDFADTSNIVDTSFAEDKHYDSLRKRSPAVLNPFYFDAIRISPSHGSGAGTARYDESDDSMINNSRLNLFDDVDCERATMAESVECKRTPRDPESLTFGIAGGAIALKRFQILDILMPDPSVLAELENADVREGKDSPFRSYYGHQPVLSDIQEETEPESGYVSRVSASCVKNRHQSGNRRDSIAKMNGSPHACSSRASEAEAEARQLQNMESPLFRRSRRSSDGFRGQDSSIISDGIPNLGFQTAHGSLASTVKENVDDDWETESDNGNATTPGDISAFGFHSAHGSMPSIKQEKQNNDWWETDTDNAEGLSLFVAIKEPTPVLSTAFFPKRCSEVPLLFDFTTSDVQPLPITPEEEKRLLAEPAFVKDGVIPQEYIRFAVSSAKSTPAYNWGPHRPDYPLRRSSLKATFCKGDAIFLGSSTSVERKISKETLTRESEYEDELADIFRKIREDFSNTPLGKMADAYLSHALLSNVDQAIALAFNYELGVKGYPSIELLASAKVLHTIIGCVKHAGDEAHRSGNSKAAVKLYDDIGGRIFVQKELDTVSAVVTKCLAQSPMAVLDKDVIGKCTLGETIDADDGDPFTDRPCDASNGQFGNSRLPITDANHTAWAQGILGSTFDGVAIAPFGFSSLASSLAMGSATLRGNIRGIEGLDLNNQLCARSRVHFTGVGSIAPGTPVGEASRYPLPYVYHPFDGTFGLIDEIVVGVAYAVGNRSSSSSSSSADLNAIVDKVGGGPVAQPLYAGLNLFDGQGGAVVIPGDVANSATNASDAARYVHADTTETADSTPHASRTPKRRPGGYNLFPADASAPHTPSQAAERERTESQDKPLPTVGTPASHSRSLGVRSILSRVPSISKKKKTDGSQGLLVSLNKPLPAIAKDGNVIFPAREAAAIDTETSQNLSRHPNSKCAPVKERPLGSMRRYGSKAIDTLKSLWSKSDQELAAKQASDRERRKKTADRVINMARDYDESRVAFPQPAAGVMMGMHAGEETHTLSQPDTQRAMDTQAEGPMLSSRARRIMGPDIEEYSHRARELYIHSLHPDPVPAQNSDATSTLRTVRAAKNNAGTRAGIFIPLAGNVASPAARTPSRIPVPAHRTSAFMEGAENVVPIPPTTSAMPAIPAPKNRGARDAIVSAMGFGSRRKSIGENTRVNGA